MTRAHLECQSILAKKTSDNWRAIAHWQLGQTYQGLYRESMDAGSGGGDNLALAKEQYTAILDECEKAGTWLPGALTKLGECASSVNDYEGDIAFDKQAIKKYPLSEWCDYLHCNIGHCYLILRDEVNSRYWLQRTIDRYPDSAWAKVAADKLACGIS